jgi:predicted O-methyltransferase YrrM
MEHPGLKNLYEQVITGNFQWDRWGLLGVLCDYVLNYVNGHILEIGCGESSIFLSKLAEKYNRICYHVEYSKSGVENMKNTKGYFGKNSRVFNMKSDEFFATVNDQRLVPLALAFIDGDHMYEQAKKDFDNTWEHLATGGYIFLHDTLPPTEEWKVPERCGTVYHLREDFDIAYMRDVLDVFTFPRSAFDVGLTMVRKK